MDWWRRPALSVRLVAVVAATLVAAGLALWQGSVWLDDHRQDERREAAIEVARAQVLDLTTLDSTTIEAKLEAMGARLSGDFKRQFDGFTETFSQVVGEGRITAVGEVRSVAVDHLDDQRASILVATSASVQHGRAKAESKKDYRMRVELERTDDTWLISGMEFVG